MKKITKKRFNDWKKEQVMKDLHRSIDYLVRKGVPIYWKLESKGNIIAFTFDPKEAEEKGCVRVFVS